MPSQEPRPNVIEIRDLVVGFGRQTVLDHVSLSVRQGEIFGLVGGSGSGKSVLLRTTIGLLPKTSGHIRILGVDRDGATPEEVSQLRRRCGVLFQQGALFSSLTVRENIEYPMREYLGLPQRLMTDIAIAKLEMVGLQARDAEKLPSELSGGMTKRVGLARALALDPEIVFLDEPNSGLDPVSAREIDALIETLRQTLSLSVFMVTHDLVSLETICDRVAVLAGGKIVAEGDAASLQHSTHPWVRRYFAPPPDVRALAPQTQMT